MRSSIVSFRKLQCFLSLLHPRGPPCQKREGNAAYGGRGVRGSFAGGAGGSPLAHILL